MDSDGEDAPRMITANSTPTVSGRLVSELKRTELQALMKKYGLKGGSKKTETLVTILEEHFASLGKSSSQSVEDIERDELMNEFGGDGNEAGEDDNENEGGEIVEEEVQEVQVAVEAAAQVTATAAKASSDDLSPSDTLLPAASPMGEVPVVAVDLVPAPSSLSVIPSSTDIPISAISMIAEAQSPSVQLSENDKAWIEKMVEEKLASALASMGISGSAAASSVPVKEVKKAVGAAVVAKSLSMPSFNKKPSVAGGLASSIPLPASKIVKPTVTSRIGVPPVTKKPEMKPQASVTETSSAVPPARPKATMSSASLMGARQSVAPGSFGRQSLAPKKLASVASSAAGSSANLPGLSRMSMAPPKKSMVGTKSASVAVMSASEQASASAKTPAPPSAMSRKSKSPGNTLPASASASTHHISFAPGTSDGTKTHSAPAHPPTPAPKAFSRQASAKKTPAPAVPVESTVNNWSAQLAKEAEEEKRKSELKAEAETAKVRRTAARKVSGNSNGSAPAATAAAATTTTAAKKRGGRKAQQEVSQEPSPVSEEEEASPLAEETMPESEDVEIEDGEIEQDASVPVPLGMQSVPQSVERLEI